MARQLAVLCAALLLVASAMAVGVIVNAAWGLGTGIGLNLFGRPHARPMRA